MTRKVALITGITGQDGSYLARFLLSKDYDVHGIQRRTSLPNTERIESLCTHPLEPHTRFFLHNGDVTDSSCLYNLMHDIQPHEIYNLAAQSHVSVSFQTPEYTTHTNALGTLRVLEAMRHLKHECRFYQASSSELYGKATDVPQTENTPFYPRSPYAIAKLYAYWLTVNYKEAYGIHASNGILFNHESPLRGETFVTRKITKAVTAIKLGLQEDLSLGNLDAKRDWGHAQDYVEGMWLMTQQKFGDNYVLATGQAHTVRQFAELAFQEAEIPLQWEGEGFNERGRNPDTGKILIKVNPRYYRPTEVDILLGDSSKARKVLGWTPKISLKNLVKEMIQEDFKKNAKNFHFSE